jgi:peroxiredoxin
VVGVVTGTTRPAAQSVVDDLGLTFPMLYDRDRALLEAVGQVNLPVTLFVDASGRVVHVHGAPTLDVDTIGRLAHEHLGVSA